MMVRRIATYLIPLVLLALAAVAVPGTSIAGDTGTVRSGDAVTVPQRTLDVVGHGTIVAKPDTAVITLGASALADTPTAAYGEVAKSLTRVAASLKELGLRDEEIQTHELNLGAEYNWTQDKGQVLKGYRASTTITITTQALDSVAALVEAAVTAGATQLQSIRFTIKEPEALTNQAMDLAVDNAKGKAERVAKRMGANIAGVIHVNVIDQNSGPVIRAEAKMEAPSPAGTASMPVFSGTNQIEVSVSATFEIR